MKCYDAEADWDWKFIPCVGENGSRLAYIYMLVFKYNANKTTNEKNA